MNRKGLRTSNIANALNAPLGTVKKIASNKKIRGERKGVGRGKQTEYTVEQAEAIARAYRGEKGVKQLHDWMRASMPEELEELGTNEGEKSEEKGVNEEEILEETPHKRQIDLTPLEKNNPNTILDGVLSEMKSASLTDDLKNYLLELGRSTIGGLSPRELYGELVSWGVDNKVAFRVAKLYDLRLNKAQKKASENHDLSLRNRATNRTITWEDEPLYTPSQPRRSKIKRNVAVDEGSYDERSLSSAKPKTRGEIRESIDVDYSPSIVGRSLEPIGYVVIDGQSIPAYSSNELLALKKYQNDTERHEKEMKKLDEEIKNIASERNSRQGEKQETEKVEVEIGDNQKTKVDPGIALAFERQKRREERKEDETTTEKTNQINRLNSIITTQNKQIEEQNKRLKEITDYLDAIKEGRVNFSGKTALDVVDTRLGDISNGAKTIINKLKLPVAYNEPIKPPEKSEEERERIAKEFEDEIDKSSELLDVENMILNE